MLERIHHTAIIASNYEESKKFYTEVLELEIIHELYREERDSYKLDLAIGDAQIELFSFPTPPKRPSTPEAQGLRHLCFEVNDIENAVRWLEHKGVEVEPIRVDPVTDKRFTFFKDPDQLPLELYEK
ncbi:VOC family protein [Marinilactibacillus sp. Marseille-P9653]|uniref:SMU1112c/YaeR family gloxylase I-like metalloprotein n=1 Tax=Marinilactibacillus sp. Marseille-P9653 TaxID=2866583 RepID=UPI001CE4568D|nr:VOC family protein [Marinilactibacillus sp. Marseille-P9653]